VRLRAVRVGDPSAPSTGPGGAASMERCHWRCGRLRVGPGSGDRASTSRYPLVSVLSPVMGAPLGARTCARHSKSLRNTRGSQATRCVAVTSIQMQSSPFPDPWLACPQAHRYRSGGRDPLRRVDRGAGRLACGCARLVSGSHPGLGRLHELRFRGGLPKQAIREFKLARSFPDSDAWDGLPARSTGMPLRGVSG